MDIIEQAAKRLEELRRAGVELPGDSMLSRERVASGEASIPPVREEKIRPASASPDKLADSRPAEAGSRRITIDMQTLVARGVVTPDSERSRLGDEIRVIKRPLLRNKEGKSAAPIRDANLIMITSALPGEGKTTIAANLAMSIAMELDHTVLLVDADVARPSLPGIFGYGHPKGLLDLLTDESIDPNQVFLRTNVDNLAILPAGTQHPRATELLASAAMQKLLVDMSRRYSDRVIIFDSPPLLLTTEARTLAAHMGQIVLVVRAERTMHNEVKRALATVETCPVKMVLLNAATSSFDEHGYGYGYGYGQGYGYGYGYQNRPQAGQEGARS